MNRNTLQQIVTLSLTKRPFTAGDRFPPSPYYRLLYQLANAIQPKLSVVLGVCGGGCCYNLAKGHYAPVLGIDISNDYPDNIEFIQKEQPNFIFLVGDSIEESINAHSGNKPNELDILFIDTIHTYQRTMDEFNAWLPYMSEKCVVCLDDLFREGMIDAWNELPGEKMRVDNLHIGGSPTDGGFGIIWDIK